HDRHQQSAQQPRPHRHHPRVKPERTATHVTRHGSGQTRPPTTSPPRHQTEANGPSCTDPCPTKNQPLAQPPRAHRRVERSLRPAPCGEAAAPPRPYLVAERGRRPTLGRRVWPPQPLIAA